MLSCCYTSLRHWSLLVYIAIGISIRRKRLADIDRCRVRIKYRLIEQFWRWSQKRGIVAVLLVSLGLDGVETRGTVTLTPRTLVVKTCRELYTSGWNEQAQTNCGNTTRAVSCSGCASSAEPSTS